MLHRISMWHLGTERKYFLLLPYSYKNSRFHSEAKIKCFSPEKCSFLVIPSSLKGLSLVSSAILYLQKVEKMSQDESILMQHNWKVIHLFLKTKYSALFLLEIFLKAGSFKKIPVLVQKTQSHIIWNNGHDSDFYPHKISNISVSAELYQVPLEVWKSNCLFSYTGVQCSC